MFRFFFFCLAVIYTCALKENNVLKVANNSLRYICYKQKPHNKYIY